MIYDSIFDSILLLVFVILNFSMNCVMLDMLLTY